MTQKALIHHEPALKNIQKNTKPLTANIIQILIVDDHPVVRDGIAHRIEKQADMAVCGEAASLSDALVCLEHTRCDLAVVDISLKGRSGIDLIKELRMRGETFPIMVLSVHDDPIYAERALAAGAQGYLLKQEAPQKIINAMRRILSGQVYVSEKMASTLLTRFTKTPKAKAHKDPVRRLSDRELEVLEAIGQCQSTRQIAENLSLSISTIETYKSRIKIKLGIRNTSELIVFASQRHLKPPYPEG